MTAPAPLGPPTSNSQSRAREQPSHPVGVIVPALAAASDSTASIQLPATWSNSTGASNAAPRARTLSCPPRPLLRSQAPPLAAKSPADARRPPRPRSAATRPPRRTPTRATSAPATPPAPARPRHPRQREARPRVAALRHVVEHRERRRTQNALEHADEGQRPGARPRPVRQVEQSAAQADTERRTHQHRSAATQSAIPPRSGVASNSPPA